jgi:Tol biopolymer transport system component
VAEDVAASDSPSVLVDEDDGLALFSAVAFSPDGSQLAFAAVDLGTAPPPPMPPAPSGWRDSSVAAGVAGHPFAQDVWLVNPSDGAGLRRVADIAENMPSVSWSGDGSGLYVLGPGFLWRLDPATGAAEMLRQSGERGAIVWLEGS